MNLFIYAYGRRILDNILPTLKYFMFFVNNSMQYVYVCIYMYVLQVWLCMYVLYACMHHVCVYACIHVCMHFRLNYGRNLPFIYAEILNRVIYRRY